MGFALRYAISFAGGAASYWLSLGAASASILMSERNFVALQSPIFPPLMGLAIFAMLFGLLQSKALRWRFWLLGAAVVAVTHFVGLLFVYLGVATVPEGFVITAILLFLAGWYLMARAVPEVAPKVQK